AFRAEAWPLLWEQPGAELRVLDREVVVVAHLRRVLPAVLDEGIPAAGMLVPAEAGAEPPVRLALGVRAGGEGGDQGRKEQSLHLEQALVGDRRVGRLRVSGGVD